MKIFPNNFVSTYQVGLHLIVYKNFIEISQGGPEIAELFINNEKFSDNFFGGPPLFFNQFLFIPIYYSKFFTRGFKIAMIDLNTSKFEIKTKCYDLILLDKVENNSLSFYIDLENSVRKAIQL